jgi:antitoxin VapB
VALYIKNQEAEALAREIASSRSIGLTEAVLSALRNERDRDMRKLSVIEATLEVQRKLREIGNPEKGLPADKEFIDSLYEDD